MVSKQKLREAFLQPREKARIYYNRVQNNLRDNQPYAQVLIASKERPPLNNLGISVKENMSIQHQELQMMLLSSLPYGEDVLYQDKEEEVARPNIQVIQTQLSNVAPPSMKVNQNQPSNSVPINLTVPSAPVQVKQPDVTNTLLLSNDVTVSNVSNVPIVSTVSKGPKIVNTPILQESVPPLQSHRIDMKLPEGDKRDSMEQFKQRLQAMEGRQDSIDKKVDGLLNNQEVILAKLGDLMALVQKLKR